jgi:hypothetical protein
MEQQATIVGGSGFCVGVKCDSGEVLVLANTFQPTRSVCWDEYIKDAGPYIADTDSRQRWQVFPVNGEREKQLAWLRYRGWRLVPVNVVPREES